MYVALYYLLPALLVCKVYNRYRISNNTLATRYKIDRLEYRLRLLEYENKKIAAEFGYVFLKGIIPIIKDNLTSLYLFPIVYRSLMFKNKNIGVKTNLDVRKLEDLIKKNHDLDLIYSEFVKIVVNYTLSKSFTMHCSKGVNRLYNYTVNAFNHTKGDIPMQKLKSSLKNVIIQTQSAYLPTFS